MPYNYQRCGQSKYKTIINEEQTFNTTVLKLVILRDHYELEQMYQNNYSIYLSNNIVHSYIYSISKI